MRQSSYFRPGAARAHAWVHVATLVCVCVLAAVLAALAWDAVVVHGKWLLWLVPACAVAVALVWRWPAWALAVWLGLHL